MTEFNVIKSHYQNKCNKIKDLEQQVEKLVAENS